VDLLNISHFCLPPVIPNVRCIAYNFDGSNMGFKDEDLETLRFENGDVIQCIEDYFVKMK
jgi:hypothetical protein